MARKKKETRIAEEFKRLDELFVRLPGNKYALVLPLLENAAFMKVELEDLRAAISANGSTETYQNGANQYGIKKSSEGDVYNTLIKNYTTVIAKLNDILKEEGQQAGDELMEFLKRG